MNRKNPHEREANPAVRRVALAATFLSALVAALASGRLPAQDAALAQPAAQPPDQPAAGPTRLYDQEPYDELHFRDGSVVAVRRLPRPLPEKPRPGDKLVVRPLDDPEKDFETTWREIDHVQLFEQIVLAEADRLVSLEKFDDAYDFFQHLTRFYPRLPGLAESLQKYNFAEAQWWLRKGRFDQALALLNDLHAKNPQFAGLEEALAGAVDKIVAGYVQKKNYAAARRLLAQAVVKYPKNPALDATRNRLVARAAEFFDQAQGAFQKGNLHEARELAYAAVRVWPLEEARKLLEDAQAQAPRVVVGVAMLPERIGPQFLDDWAARRASRLLHRTVMEFTGAGPQGGEYRCPIGEIQRAGLGRRIILNVNPSVRWSVGPTGLTGYDLARHLAAMADPAHEAFRHDWAEVFAGASVRDVFEVEIELKRAHVIPDRLLETAIVPWGNVRDAATEEIPTLGPYVIHSATADEVRYRANPYYFAPGSRQPQEIVEKRFKTGRAAVSALRAGEIQVLDRVNPWDVDVLRATANIAVEPYAVPTVHVLIPRGDHPLLKQRIYRHAIVYGTNRRAILEQILKGDQTPGNAVVSGPFPAPRGAEDSLGYAYDDDVAPRPYNPRLALVLASLAQRTHAELEKKRAEKEKAKQAKGTKPAEKKPAEEKPAEEVKITYAPLVLAHPANEVARAACRAIQRQLQLVGIPVQLLEMTRDPAAGPPKYDLLYAELAVSEPVVDAHRLLGDGGLAEFSSPATRQAVRQLESLSEWRRIRQKLYEIHRLSADDMALMPLWQLTDFLAYHKAVKGVQPKPATLYQSVETWEGPPAFLGDVAGVPATLPKPVTDAKAR